MEDNNKSFTGDSSSFDKIDPQIIFDSLPIHSDSIILYVVGGDFNDYIFAMAPLCPHGKIFAFYLGDEEGMERFMDEISVSTFANIFPKAITPFSLPLGSRTIDICLLITVFHNLFQLNSDWEMLREIKRVLKPGGTLAAIELKKIIGTSGSPIKKRIAPGELDEKLRCTGFIPKQEIETELYHCLSLYRVFDN